MHKLSTTLLSVLLIAATPAKADNVVTAAAVVIKAQHALLDLRAKRINDLDDENEKLGKALVEMKELNDKNLNRQLTYGAIGVALGLIAGFIAAGHR